MIQENVEEVVEAEIIRKGFVLEAWTLEEDSLVLCYQEPLKVLRELTVPGSLLLTSIGGSCSRGNEVRVTSGHQVDLEHLYFCLSFFSPYHFPALWSSACSSVKGEQQYSFGHTMGWWPILHEHLQKQFENGTSAGQVLKQR